MLPAAVVLVLVAVLPAPLLLVIHMAWLVRLPAAVAWSLPAEEPLPALAEAQ